MNILNLKSILDECDPDENIMWCKKHGEQLIASVCRITVEKACKEAVRMALEVKSLGHLIFDEHPVPHRKYIVLRKEYFFTATPCYGLHTPYWVVTTMNGEAPPVNFHNDDRWWPLDSLIICKGVGV